MKPDISEFSYGFALTSELIEKFALKQCGAPLFPTLHAEGSTGGGYDVKLPGSPMFIQFKLSDKLTRKNALSANPLGLPHYRFKLRSRKISQQHDLLLALEQKYNLVYYAAPYFSTSIDFDKHYICSEIIKHTIFVKPSSIGDITDDVIHSISFSEQYDKAILRSNPREIAISNIDTEVRDEAALSRDTNPDQRITFEQLFNELSTLFERHTSDENRSREEYRRSIRSDLIPSQYVRQMSLSLFGVDVLYV